MKTEIKMIPVKLLEQNRGQVSGLPKNPRFFRDYRYEAMVKSMRDCPEMLEGWGFEFPQEKEKDPFKERFESIKDDDAVYPLIPKYDERHELFIIQSGSEVDSNWLRERLGMQKMKSYKTGKLTKSNVIDIKDVRHALEDRHPKS